MGSRSKSRSSNTSGQTQNTMNQLAQGRTDNSVLMGQQAQMRNDMLSQVAPMFDAMVQNGMSVFNSNPNYDGQMSAPMSLMDIFSAMQPQEPAPQQQAPQEPWMQGMTPEQIAAIQRFNGYGGRR